LIVINQQRLKGKARKVKNYKKNLKNLIVVINLIVN